MPPAAKEDEEVSFPLILHIDSTPGSQLVSEEFKVDWNHYLASQKSFIVAQIDGRGSGYQVNVFEVESILGDSFENPINNDRISLS